VNSAGIGGWNGSVMSDQTWDEVIKINLYGTFYSCREVVRVMIQQQEEASSTSRRRRMKGVPALARTRRARVGDRTDASLALEVARDHVRVNAIAPAISHGHERRASMILRWPKIMRRIPLRRVDDRKRSPAGGSARQWRRFLHHCEVYCISGGEMAA